MNIKTIRTIEKIAAQDIGRYAINGIYIEPTGDDTVSATATDGRRLVTITEPGDGVDRPAILPLAPLKGLAKDARVAVNGDIRAVNRDTTTILEEYPGDFPDYRTFTPLPTDDNGAELPCTVVHVSPTYLTELARSAADWLRLQGVKPSDGAAYNVRLVIPHEDGEGQRLDLDTASGDSTWRAILMPVTVR